MSEADATTKPDPGFSSIYQEHFNTVFRFGFRLLGDPDTSSVTIHQPVRDQPMTTTS